MKTLKLKILAVTFVLLASMGQAQQKTTRNDNRGNTVNTNNGGNKGGNGQSNQNGGQHIEVKQNIQPHNVNRNQITYRNQDPKVNVVRNTNLQNPKPVTHNQSQFYMSNGYYYKQVNNNYVRAAAPIGLRINVLPVGYISINLGNSLYYYYEGTYYSGNTDNYIVVTPPVGAIVYALPADYEKVVENGVIYYEYNGVLYSKVTYNGQRAYQVVGYVN